MKVKIVTVFKSENCGSFLQAWALKKQLSFMENEVVFSDYKRPNTGFDKAIAVMKCCLKLKFRRARDILKKSKAFSKHQKSLKIEKVNEKADMYLYGSDTLWNFDDNFFYKNAGFFSGENVSEPRYTFAISVGSTQKETFVKNEKIIENIQKFKKIAIRDSHTSNVLSAFYPQEKMVRVVDPTMLLNKEEYIKSFCNKKPICENSLVIYYFGKIPEKTYEEIKIFANKKGLKIVNIGIREKRFDKSIASTPKAFITEFANAKYIFTNTFHGCVFSILFNKQFATNGMHKKKIEGLLEEFSLNDRFVLEGQNLENVFMSPIDYINVNSVIQQGRERSIDYLRAVVKEVKGYE